MTTPMMLQWQKCKEMAPDTILLFRMGDFYEVFHEDASLAARELELTLTQRQGIPMAGVPAGSVDSYVDRLIAKGYRVAIAEQIEDPRQVKGLVKREVVRVVTPGTATESSLVADNANNFIASVTSKGKTFGLAFLDLSTAQFQVMETKEQRLLVDELHRLHPSEVLVGDHFLKRQTVFMEELKRVGDPLVSNMEEWRFEQEVAEELLKEHFGVTTLHGFGLQEMGAGTAAAGALLYYLRDKLCQPLDHIRSISAYHTGAFLAIDKATQRNLELIRNLRDGTRKNTLFSTLDHTKTPMGGRLLQQWICQPLLNLKAIHKRQEAVTHFFTQRTVAESCAEQLSHVRDLERLTMKVSAGYATPRDLLALAHSLKALPLIRAQLMEAEVPQLLCSLGEAMGDLNEVADQVIGTISAECPVRLQDGGVIREGVHPELDELRKLQCDSKSWISCYQQQLRESLGIKTLKVGFNRVFGYYLEVSRGQAARMPETFQRRQTLTNSERFISPELKEYEQKILSAEERISSLEQELFLTLRRKVAGYTKEILESAAAVAQLDVLLGFAYVAKERGYTQPLVVESTSLQIEEGRHPVIEACQPFTSNSSALDGENQHLHLITGPNMGGKSTYIRQVALLTLMAQMGSYLPAKSATIGMVDRLFSRIGASDDLAAGQSTFMVEMTEAANILNNATGQSLVILDEIGRGTSTYDGISIAWAIAEHLLALKTRTLFATHYFELTRLAETQEGVENFHVSAEEVDGKVVFLRKVVVGPADRSYGIHVGQLAGLPLRVIRRAEQLLSELEEQKAVKITPKRRRRTRTVETKQQTIQLSLFEPIQH